MLPPLPTSRTGQPQFVHLRVHTAYSLLEGACQIKPLVKKAVAAGMPALGISDTNNLFGSLEFSAEAAGSGVQPILGVLLHFQPPGAEQRRGQGPKPEQLLLIAKDEAGLTNLLSLASDVYLAPVESGAQGPVLDYGVLEGRCDGLLCLTAGRYGGLGQRLLAGQDASAEELLGMLQTHFPDRLYIELMRHQLAEEKTLEPKFLALAQSHRLPIVATNDVEFFDKDMFEAHDALMCIAQGRYLGEGDRARLNPHFRFKSPKEMHEIFADLPEAVANTLAIAQRCAVMAAKRDPILPNFGEGGTEDDQLRRRAAEGLEYRLEHYVFNAEMDATRKAELREEYTKRLAFELDVICKMKFPGYFLIVSDFITWSKEHDIPVGPGRGSGAGSLVAWSLLITDLDPLRYGLLFERFLNPERVSMPDFDVDFCQDRRGEVIQYVQQKYGRDQVAQIITFGTLQARAALRDVGRVLQLPYGLVDRVCKMVPNNPAHPTKLAEAIEIEPNLKEAIKKDEQVSHMVDIALKLEGLYRHASMHAAGVVIADRPLSQLVPMYRDPNSDMPVVQYSMKYAELAGLVKFDFLGLKTLSVLHQAVKMIAQVGGPALDLLKLPEGDKKTYELLGRGEAAGVFQLESAGMRDTLRKLKPDNIEDIIALVSLYRPGPMSNIPTYIARKHGLEVPQYPHPDVEEILKETYGVIIYQEQVMQIAQKLSGYSLAQADLLRRAMGKKIRAEMEAQRESFVAGATARKVPKHIATQIFDLMAKFAEYGFNKSHAAAYALIAYQTAYLKANHTVEFLAASMNYDTHNTDKLAMFREEANKFGIAVLPPDVNKSDVLFAGEKPSPPGRRLDEGLSAGSVAGGEALIPAVSQREKESAGAIRYGLAAVRNVGAEAMRALVEERRANGLFRDMFDFVERADPKILNRRQMEHLIKAGAFDSLFPNRKQLMLALEMLLAHGQSMARDRESQQSSLFGGPSESAIAAPRPNMPGGEDWKHLEKLEQEFEAIGFYLSAHPISDYQEALVGQGVTHYAALMDALGPAYTPITLAGIVMGRKIRASERGRFAFLSLSDPTGLYEIAIYDEQILNAQQGLLENGQLLLIKAEGKVDDSGARIVARQIMSMEATLAKYEGRAKAGPSGHWRVTLSDMRALAPLKTLLGEPNGQGVRVSFSLAVGEASQAVVMLPGTYRLSQADLAQLEKLPGVAAAQALS